MEKCFYVSTGYDNKTVAKQIVQALESSGMRCTYDWTDSTLGGMIYTEEQNEVRGVRNADFMICVLPGGKGTHVELGLAIANKIPIYLYAPDNDYFDAASDKFCFFYVDKLIHRQLYGLADTNWLVRSIEIASKVLQVL